MNSNKDPDIPLGATRRDVDFLRELTYNHFYGVRNYV